MDRHNIPILLLVIFIIQVTIDYRSKQSMIYTDRKSFLSGSYTSLVIVLTLIVKKTPSNDT